MKTKPLLLICKTLGLCMALVSCTKSTDYGDAANYLKPSSISITWRNAQHVYANNDASGNYLSSTHEFNVLGQDTDNNNYVQLLFVDSTASRDTFSLRYPTTHNATLVMSVNDTLFTTNITGSSGSYYLTGFDSLSKVFTGKFSGKLVAAIDTTKSIQVSDGSFTVYYR